MKVSQILLVALMCVLYVAPFYVHAIHNRHAAPTTFQQLKQDIRDRILKDEKLTDKMMNFSFKQINGGVAVPKPKGGFSLCPMCINLLDQTINQLLNIILQGGVIGSCGALCSYLSNFGSLTVAACNLICDYLGVEEFIKLIQEADLDAIYGCQLVALCPVHDCKLPVCAQFFNTRVVPQSAPKGTTFTAVSQLRVYNQTGTGELAFEVNGPVTGDISGGELVAEGFSAGVFQIQVQIQAQDDPNNQVVWNPGTYEFVVAACEGECGSKHPHSRILAEAHALFNVTA
ncbi:hypothetical protein FDP41_004260 [Naegleria fowleri]|uniref:Saposin B-type domain-containing protein n=1 Tax=Naegleria fowleri TaxID=5763 RepID=A0A6A5BUG2_NAEFO|nr:uncharacterized protein FDP41_004260 [Naegleria fowleri]KAF0976965.1 hypothetical protein FDP41_004260 [Naegleria fowleri]